MATPNKRKLTALNKENCEEHPRSNLAQNSNVPRSQEGYITQVSEEIEGRVTKKLLEEFSKTENRILGALARLDDFLMNPLIQGYSGTTPEMSRNAFSTNQGTNEDDPQSDPHPEAGIFGNQTMRNCGQEDQRDTKFADDWNSSPYVSSWRLSSCGCKKPTWQDSRQRNATQRSLKPAWKHTNIAKPISNGIWSKPHCLNGQHWV